MRRTVAGSPPPPDSPAQLNTPQMGDSSLDTVLRIES